MTDPDIASETGTSSEGALSGGSGRKALLVVNSASRRAKEAQPYIDALTAGGLTLIRKECDQREDMTGLIGSMRNEVDCVILAGGDGTMSGAAVALRETGLPLGILPTGTANDLARTLQLPLEPGAAASVILAGKTRQIDLGFVNGRPFFNVASVGLTVQVTQKLTHASKQRLGKLAYPWAALRVIIASRRFSAILRCGGTVHRVRTMQITVGNGRFYGGGMQVHADARIDDHLLDVYSLEPSSKWNLLLMAREFHAGEHDNLAEVRTDRSSVVEIVTRRPQSVSADGEIVTVTPARFSVVPGAVTVYTP